MRPNYPASIYILKCDNLFHPPPIKFDPFLLFANSNTAVQSGTGLGILAANDAVRTAPDTKTALDSLPALDCADVDDDTTECNAPLPGDDTMLEHLLVDDRNVNNGEHDDQSGHNSEEEEAIAPDCRKDGKAGWC